LSIRQHIPVCRPYLWGPENRYVSEALESGWISSAGPHVDAFEKNFAAYCGVVHGAACCNGTAALHLALTGAGVSVGHEVLVPDFTMISPVQAVLACGATPVFIDADPITWTMDVEQIEDKITSRTYAILAVHIYGHPCEMDVINEIARRKGLVVIEDAAEAHGAEVRGRRAGSLGDVSAFSFYANKIITTGEGGMVLTNDSEIDRRVRAKRNLCFGTTDETRFLHEELGFNYRMTNLQAAVGLGQMHYVDEAVREKRRIAARYCEALQGIPGLILPSEAKWALNVYWVFGITVSPEFGISRQRLQRQLNECGIETRPFFQPMHRQPALSSLKAPVTPVSAQLADTGLYLPSFINMEDALIDRVADAIRLAVT